MMLSQNQNNAFERGFKKNLQERYEREKNRPKPIEITGDLASDDDLSDIGTPNVFPTTPTPFNIADIFSFGPLPKRSHSDSDTTFSLTKEPKRHLSDSSEVKSDRKCPNCSAIYPDFDALAKHIATHFPTETVRHGEGKTHYCRLCQRGFARSDMLTRHMRLHTGIKPYECKLCNQVFSRSDHLNTHLRTHTGEKPYQCQYCSYAACRRDMITRHLRIHARKGQGQINGQGNRGRRTSSGSSDIRKSSASSYDYEPSDVESPRWPPPIWHHQRSSTSSVESSVTEEAQLTDNSTPSPPKT